MSPEDRGQPEAKQGAKNKKVLYLFPLVCFLREETSNSVYMFLSTIIDFLFTLVQGAKRKRGVGRRRTRLWIGTLFVRTVYICIYSYFYLYIYIYARYKYTCRTPHFRSGYFIRVEFLIVVFGVMYT
jgi:hypothetical protein